LAFLSDKQQNGSGGAVAHKTMKMDLEQVERLISRHLDGEASAEQQRELRVALRRSDEARALFEEMSGLDREINAALRDALGANGRTLPVRFRTLRVGWTAGLAAAACLALVSWWNPTVMHKLNDNARRGGMSTISVGDMYGPQAPSYDYPRVKVKDTNRQYLMIPADRPGEYLLIEVNRVQTQAVPLHRDF
jgi:hypothetical protein